jgi:hypothetical protein
MWAALIPAILQAGSGIASGVANVEQNADNEYLKKVLEGRAANAIELAAPLGKALLANLVPGGRAEGLYAAKKLTDAANERDELTDDARADAWKYGGAGQGQSGGFLARSPYEYLTAAALAKAAARSDADEQLAELYLDANDFNPIRTSRRYEDTYAVADILRGLSNIKY